MMSHLFGLALPCHTSTDSCRHSTSIHYHSTTHQRIIQHTN